MGIIRRFNVKPCLLDELLPILERCINSLDAGVLIQDDDFPSFDQPTMILFEVISLTLQTIN